MNDKFSSIAIITFNALTYYLVSNVLLVPYLIKMYGRNSFLYPLFFIPIAFLLIVVFNTKSIKGIKKSILKGKILRRLLIIYYTFIALFLLIYISTMLNSLAFHMTNIRFIYISTILIVCYIAYYGISTIINLSTIFLIIIPILIALPLITAELYLNHDLVLPIENINSNIVYLLVLAVIPLDMLLFNIFENHSLQRMKKRYYVIPCVFIFVLLSINLYVNTTAFSIDYLKTLKFPAFAIYESLKISKDFDNYDIVLIYIICISTIFKASHCIYMVRLLAKLKRKKDNYLNIAIFFVIVGLVILNYKSTIEQYSELFLYIMPIIPIIFYITYLTKKGDDFYGV